MDFKNISNDTLWKKFDEAASNYYREATKPCGNGKDIFDSLESKKLEEVTKQYEDIGDELRRRLGIV